MSTAEKTAEPRKAETWETWILMSKIWKDFDDLAYDNALRLCERLYAIDVTNEDYLYLYGLCLFHSADYDGAYMVLRTAQSIKCRYVFAMSCLRLGTREYLMEGYAAASQALLLHQEESDPERRWGDADDCFKITAYYQLCDIGPDGRGSKDIDSPETIFEDLQYSEKVLERCSQQHRPRYPVDANDKNDGSVVASREQPDLKWKDSSPYMPNLETYESPVTKRHLQKAQSALTAANAPMEELRQRRRSVELKKDEKIGEVKSDIETLKAEAEYRNEHGLHKKPPPDVTNDIKIKHIDIRMENAKIIEQTPSRGYRSISSNVKSADSQRTETATRKRKVNAISSLHETRQKSTIARSNTNTSRLTKKKPLSGTSLPMDKRQKTTTNTQAKANASSVGLIDQSLLAEANQEQGKTVITAMNKVIGILRILATGYLHAANYQCRETSLVLQQLDDQQYETAWVQCAMGKAYYDAGDYQTAERLFSRSFLLWPWYCDAVPYHSTCLWYLQKEMELNILASKMQENKSHQYEAFIAAGNWASHARSSKEAIYWYQRAADIDPSRSYAHALLGQEEWEREEFLVAMTHFRQCISADRRSYTGWHGLGLAYEGLQLYPKAKAAVDEAVRLHPRHPFALCTLGDILAHLGKDQEALMYLDQSMKIFPTHQACKLRARIFARLKDPERALEELLRLIELDQSELESADFRYQLGIAYSQLGQRREAINNLTEATSRLRPWDYTSMPKIKKALSEAATIVE
ncbi:anaphase-promoting complex subunit cdc27 [Umbelopsis sp. WA50703]